MNTKPENWNRARLIALLNKAANGQTINLLELEGLPDGPVLIAKSSSFIEPSTGKKWSATTIYEALKQGKHVYIQEKADLTIATTLIID